MAVSASQQFFERLWYKPTAWWLWLFLPLQLFLRVIVWLRQTFYKVGWFKSTRISRPVVVVGNINVGGTGKTPLSIYLIEWLAGEGYKPGLVTRGYGGSSSDYPLLVSNELQPRQCGDEPYLIYHRTKATVVVDPIRSRGAAKLVELGCDIILCDDGLQHYSLQRDLEIAVIDSSRRLGNGWLMPMGPLREPPSRLRNVDITIVNGKDMGLKPQPIKSLANSSTDIGQHIDAVAAIGNPGRFFDTLISEGYKVNAHAFPDHHKFEASDFDGLKGPIIMTEKDAVKCYTFADERMYYLPVNTVLTEDCEKLVKSKILQLLQ
ncbi:tetraacyldisaccharide 4'-kinase [Kangiella sediminilitoris]|uniref:Tetraacyldisaccharide 4'-kinase n=1 Tax=Kangiella sediminilitoris TaxID=1144748 RepID=A0A1B3BAS8_9GAMM|nr:tetraacyldisaccharide 4'-kinase [Kangiella sediminilitoris]AOE49874.1 Tetraacyldisaccharide 4'-kinase [Kangiella sediminilitoris]